MVSKTRLIYANKKLHPLPSSLLEMLQKRSPFSKPLASYILPSLFAKVCENKKYNMNFVVIRKSSSVNYDE